MAYDIGTYRYGALKDLKDRFSFYLGDTLRCAPHTLGVEAEGVLAATGKVLAQLSAIHDQLADADLPYPEFTLPTGDDRNERKAVFDAFRGTWHKFEGTVGATLTTQVMGDVFAAKARKFDSALSAALFHSNMPDGVCRTLVAQSNAALPTLHRYLKMRKACRPAHAFSTCWQPPGPIRRWLRVWTT
jgi:oligoendopeptidase F